MISTVSMNNVFAKLKHIIMATFLMLMVGTVVTPIMPATSVYAMDELNSLVGTNGQVVKDTNDKGDKLVSKLIDKYKTAITTVMSIATLTMVLIMVMNLGKLASAGTNPSARSAALQGILWTALATIGLGGVTMWIGLFYNAGSDTKTTTTTTQKQ